MLVSLKEINKYVIINDIAPKDIADKLTFAGIEVEDVNVLASGTNLVIGEIIDCVEHPDSNHLHVLNVNLGEKYGVKQIVCGAPNARKGLKVIVARVGAVLPGGTINSSTIRGVDSDGMCCSLLELGVDAKYLNEYQTKGIEELPLNAPIGEEDVFGYLGLNDTVLNLKVLANRPDLLSIYNVAREIGALFSRKVNIPEIDNKGAFDSGLVVGSETDKCLQFSAREIKDIKVGPSPKWLSNFLMASGIRSINNIVDIGNYVMLLTGQPLHMYDADKLNKPELVVKDNLNCDFVALDEKTYKIIPNDIVITSNDKPVCLGGVMGAFDCAVDENTKHIYIESASFDGASIRHTSSRLGLASESSSRFVKGTNHFQSEEVLSLTSSLVEELCNAKRTSHSINYIKETYKERAIDASVKRINARLSTDFSFNQIEDVLTKLYFNIKKVDEDNFKVLVPKFRLDINGEADLSEEVIRVLGFDNVKSELPTLDTKLGGYSLEQSRLRKIREFLTDSGLDECLTYSLVSKKEINKLNLLNKNEEAYVILNPLTDEHEVFRLSLLHSLLKVVSYNVARQAKSLALFETSEIISKTSRSNHLAIALYGEVHSHGLMEIRNYDFFDMKGIVENIFALLGIETSRYKIEKSSLTNNELHPGKSANISFQGKVIGHFGELHPNQFKEYDLGKTSCVILELDISSILASKVSQIKMQEIGKFPTVSRDLALVIDKSIPSSDIIRTIRITGKGIVNDAQVFDVYCGENIDVNKKSIAIKITYMSNEHTLNDEEINEAENRIKFALSKDYSIELRK